MSDAVTYRKHKVNCECMVHAGTKKQKAKKKIQKNLNNEHVITQKRASVRDRNKSVQLMT